MNHDHFAAVAAVQDDAVSYLIGFAAGVAFVLLVDVLLYHLTKRGPRQR